MRPALMMVQSFLKGTGVPAALLPCLMKRVLAKSECQACSVMTWTPRRYFWSAPA